MQVIYDVGVGSVASARLHPRVHNGTDSANLLLVALRQKILIENQNISWLWGPRLEQPRRFVQ